MKRCAGIGSLVFVFLTVGALSVLAQPGQPEPPPEPAPAPVPSDPQPVPTQPQPVPQPAPPPGPAPVPLPPGGGGGGFDAVPLDHQAHIGFLARAVIGFGYQQISEEVGGSELKISGLASTFMLGFGFAIMPRLAITLDIGGVGMANPTVEIDGMEFDSEDTTIVAIGIGPGVTYYLPSNAYVAGALLFGNISIEVDGDEGDTDTGAALSILGGKEWWVGSNLGVGVVGHLMVGGYPDGGDGVDETVSSASFTINFSATYN